MKAFILLLGFLALATAIDPFEHVEYSDEEPEEHSISRTRAHTRNHAYSHATTELHYPKPTHSKSAEKREVDHDEANWETFSSLAAVFYPSGLPDKYASRLHGLAAPTGKGDEHEHEHAGPRNGRREMNWERSVGARKDNWQTRTKGDRIDDDDADGPTTVKGSGIPVPTRNDGQWRHWDMTHNHNRHKPEASPSISSPSDNKDIDSDDEKNSDDDSDSKYENDSADDDENEEVKRAVESPAPTTKPSRGKGSGLKAYGTASKSHKEHSETHSRHADASPSAQHEIVSSKHQDLKNHASPTPTLTEKARRSFWGKKTGAAANHVNNPPYRRTPDKDPAREPLQEEELDPRKQHHLRAFPKRWSQVNAWEGAEATRGGRGRGRRVERG